MKIRSAALITALLLGFAAPVTAHSFTDREDPLDNHYDCEGTRDWFDVSGEYDSSIWKTHANITLGGQMEVMEIYVHSPPHSDPSYQDPDRETPAGTIQMPGVIWQETNGLSSLQKNDYFCNLEKHGNYSVHSDTVIL